MSYIRVDKKCPICGKRFEPPDTSIWAYKRYVSSTSYIFFCSWGCLREDERRRDEAYKKKHGTLPSYRNSPTHM